MSAGELAQLVGHLHTMQKVLGSNPPSGNVFMDVLGTYLTLLTHRVTEGLTL